MDNFVDEDNIEEFYNKVIEANNSALLDALVKRNSFSQYIRESYLRLLDVYPH